MNRLADFSAVGLDGKAVHLSQFAGQVALVVNTASKCGFTSQFAGLQRLYSEYRDAGFTVLGFPCNQFLNQEPGSAAAIEAFCKSEYQVDFPMFEKVHVNGERTHPLYAWMKKAAPGIMGSTAIKWNFTKFLIDRSGNPVVRYAPTMEPQNIAPTIERLLRG